MSVRVLRFTFGCESAPHAYKLPRCVGGGFGVCFGRLQVRVMRRRYDKDAA